ncbi:MAG: TonB family protein [Acidobacteria bacterium]|nr:TonB family protein [Acidobacteriota bacterium]
MTPSNEELRSLFGVEEQLPPRPWRAIAGASIGIHLVLAFLLKEVPIFEARRFTGGPDVVIARRITPVFAPSVEPTQNTPNKAKINRDFDVDSLKPRPAVQIPDGPPSTTRPAARAPVPLPVPANATPPKPLAEPPRVEAPIQARNIIPPQLGVPDSPPPPPQIQTQEKPKLAFEPVGAGGASRQPGQGERRVPMPSNSVSEAVQSMARSRPSGGLMVGDLGDGVGGVGEGLHQPPSPGKTGSNLELLSDPQGVDFRPYLVRVLAAVRRNWFAVIPESARLGNQRGRVLVQFAIDRAGKVPKLVISVPSGAQPLDRAAVAGISASNPFPPLPGEFKGDQIRLQLTFSYNMNSR